MAAETLDGRKVATAVAPPLAAAEDLEQDDVVQLAEPDSLEAAVQETPVKDRTPTEEAIFAKLYNRFSGTL